MSWPQREVQQMRTLIVSEFVSVDGVMEAPGGEAGYAHSGWTMEYGSDEMYRYKLDEALEAESLLLGRITYEGFVQAWPERDDEAGFAAKMNAMPKHVVSTTLRDPTWTNSFVLPDASDAVRALNGDGGPILVAGSRTLVRALYEQDLVDEYRLLVFPVVLGSGRRLFPDDVPNKRGLTLVQSQNFSGVQLQIFRPA